MTVRLRVRVHPGARTEGVRGLHPDGVVRLDVRAAAEDGRANRAAAALLAGVLGVPRSAIAIVQGHGSRNKVIEVNGLTEDEAKRRVEEVAGRGQ